MNLSPPSPHRLKLPAAGVGLLHLAPAHRTLPFPFWFQTFCRCKIQPRKHPPENVHCWRIKMSGPGSDAAPGVTALAAQPSPHLRGSFIRDTGEGRLARGPPGRGDPRPSPTGARHAQSVRGLGVHARKRRGYTAATEDAELKAPTSTKRRINSPKQKEGWTRDP